MGEYIMAIDLTGGQPLERDYVFAERPGPDVRDAANIWLEEENGAFAMRVGIEGLAEDWEAHEIWLDIAFPDGRVISGRERGKSHPAIGPEGKPTILGAGPLEFRCIEPFKHWSCNFATHNVAELTAAQLIADVYPEHPPMRAVAFGIDFFPAAPPLVSGTLTEDSVALMSGEQGSFISPRFEQLCRAHGFLEIDGIRREFKAQVLRIKRQGVRKFEGFWGHCWQSALFPSGRAFGINVFPPRADGKPSFNEGFIFDGDGVLKPARAVQMPWMKNLLTHGEDVPLVLETADGLVTIQGTTYINCRSRGGAGGKASDVPASFPIVQQSHATYTWDGETATGMIERSTLRGQMEM
jgi:hypothetical protein